MDVNKRSSSRGRSASRDKKASSKEHRSGHKDKDKDKDKDKGKHKDKERSKSKSKKHKDEAASGRDRSASRARTSRAASISGDVAPGVMDKEATDVFARFDAGRKGYLDRDEFQSALNAIRREGSLGERGPTMPAQAHGHAQPYGWSSGIARSATNYAVLSKAGAGNTVYGLSAPPPLPPPDASRDRLAGGAEPGTAALAQAYQTRMAALSSVAATLLGKREALAHQASRIQARITEVSAARQAIENETMADTEAVLHRLRSAEAAKLSVLQTDMDTLLADISGIDSFYSSFQSFQPLPSSATLASGGLASFDSQTALGFMRSYPEMCAEADRLVAKSFSSDISVRADDFERETAARLDAQARVASLVDLVAAKDRIILQLIKEREELLAQRDTAAAEAEKLRAQQERAKLATAMSARGGDTAFAHGTRARSASPANGRAEYTKALPSSEIVAMSGGAAAEEEVDMSAAPLDVQQWIQLTEHLTSELSEVTDRLARLQAFSNADADAFDGAPSFAHAVPDGKPPTHASRIGSASVLGYGAATQFTQPDFPFAALNTRHPASSLEGVAAGRPMTTGAPRATRGLESTGNVRSAASGRVLHSLAQHDPRGDDAPMPQLLSRPSPLPVQQQPQRIVRPHAVTESKSTSPTRGSRIPAATSDFLQRLGTEATASAMQRAATSQTSAAVPPLHPVSTAPSNGSVGASTVTGTVGSASSGPLSTSALGSAPASALAAAQPATSAFVPLLTTPAPHAPMSSPPTLLPAPSSSSSSEAYIPAAPHHDANDGRASSGMPTPTDAELLERRDDNHDAGLKLAASTRPLPVSLGAMP